MKFVLTEAWPVAGGSVLVPAGTEIDGRKPEWRGIRLPLPMGLNAKAMDDEAYRHLVQAHAFRNDSLAGIQYDASVRPAKRTLDGRILFHDQQ